MVGRQGVGTAHCRGGRLEPGRAASGGVEPLRRYGAAARDSPGRGSIVWAHGTSRYFGPLTARSGSACLPTDGSRKADGSLDACYVVADHGCTPGRPKPCGLVRLRWSVPRGDRADWRARQGCVHPAPTAPPGPRRFLPPHCQHAPCTRMQWPDNTAPQPEQPALQGPARVCSACGRRGRWHRCSRCLSARYCSVDCQSAHWPAHRQHCTNRSAGPLGGSSPAANTALQHTAAAGSSASCPPAAGSYPHHAEAPAFSVTSPPPNVSGSTTRLGTGLDGALPDAGR